ncbi:MAG TPA: DUF4835 family protein [Chitinophagaceae bacterium]|nr:DUF4835 family protein [Chitinophagaceae bacterium]
MRQFILLVFLLVTVCSADTQELQARITVNASQIGTKINRSVFQTLQTALNNFLNNRKWTSETFQPNEKIACNFLLTINEVQESNIFKATLTIQAARPVFNTAYDSPLINFIDNDIVFRYVEFQPIEFNENRVSGSDGMASNLTAVLAYYINIILGLDFSSFSLRGGDPYFQKAQNIVNNAPGSRDIAGWNAFDGQRNRYWLMENLTNSKYALIHEVFYGYYRLGMDNMYENPTEARKAIMNTLNLLNNLNTANPNLMIMAFFFQGKSNELIKVFKKAPADERSRAMDLLTKLDITNLNAYKQELK